MRESIWSSAGIQCRSHNAGRASKPKIHGELEFGCLIRLVAMISRLTFPHTTVSGSALLMIWCSRWRHADTRVCNWNADEHNTTTTQNLQFSDRIRKSRPQTGRIQQAITRSSTKARMKNCRLHGPLASLLSLRQEQGAQAS